MSILDEIVSQKQREVARLPASEVTATILRTALAARGGARDFIGALRRPPRASIALIAEIKQASPSAGLIRPGFDPVRLALDYKAAGAACLSVLTDEKYFQGSLAHLRAARAAVDLPVLRKDFIIDARQILEAVEARADAILLIVAILADEQLRHFHALATGAGLAALVEVHDEAELDRALAIGAELIGVNNRDLRVFRTDLGTPERLAAKLRSAPAGASKLLVAESGIHTRADVERLQRATAQALLVGESLLREQDIPAKVRELLG